MNIGINVQLQYVPRLNTECLDTRRQILNNTFSGINDCHVDYQSISISNQTVNATVADVEQFCYEHNDIRINRINNRHLV